LLATSLLVPCPEAVQYLVTSSRPSSRLMRQHCQAFGSLKLVLTSITWLVVRWYVQAQTLTVLSTPAFRGV
jgi:hypothetical protein